MEKDEGNWSRVGRKEKRESAKTPQPITTKPKATSPRASPQPRKSPPPPRIVNFSIVVCFQGAEPAPMQIGTLKRPRSGTIDSQDGEVLKVEAVHVAAKNLKADEENLQFHSFVQVDNSNNIASVREVIITQRAGTLPICPSCVRLEQRMKKHRDKALLRQAAANVGRIIKEDLYFRTPQEYQESMLWKGFVSWDLVEKTKVKSYLAVISEAEIQSFLLKFSFNNVEEVYRLFGTVGRLKDLFNGEAHPTTHLDDTEATYESLLESLDSMGSEDVEGASDLLQWLQYHKPYGSYLYNEKNQE